MRNHGMSLVFLGALCIAAGCASAPVEPATKPDAGADAGADRAASTASDRSGSAAAPTDPGGGTTSSAAKAASGPGGGGDAAAGEVAGPKPYPERWYANAVMYEVMVRSFQDSDGDGIGDLKGLISRLDYLNTGDPLTTTDLKVDGLWLMPIFKSPSYHGYDATDYYQIDPKYGTLDDFKVLVREAHRRNIRILLDLVLNHTSNQHPWFQQSGKGPDSPMRAWYVWRNDDPGWVRPWGGGPVWHKRGDAYFYGLFWEGMPDLNFNHPPVREEMLKIAKFWVDQGADGYRLDAIRYLFEEGKDRQADLSSTHGWLKHLSGALHRQNPEVALVGEAWTETENVVPYYGRGDELDLAFGFDEASGILQSLQTGKSRPLADALARVDESYPERRFSAPFLTNHDMDRLATILGPDPAKLRLAVTTLLSLPGTPFLYQGEEIGLTQGERPGDEGKRTPMQWDATPGGGFTTGRSWNPLSGHQDKVSVAAQQGRPDSLISLYQKLIRMRKSSAALRNGEIEHGFLPGGEDNGALSFARIAQGEIVICLINFGDRPAAAGMALDGMWFEKAGIATTAVPRAVDLLTGKALEVKEGAIKGSFSLSLSSLAPRTAVWARLSAP